MRKLRTWVKVVLWIMLVGVLVLIFKLANDMTNKAIESCVEGGNDYAWCVRELKK